MREENGTFVAQKFVEYARFLVDDARPVTKGRPDTRIKDHQPTRVEKTRGPGLLTSND
ncbi:hypothetical protein Cp87MAT_1707 [Corynebacterium pseudotuberculosis]|nr:hypothetical protein CpCap1W_1693 [Corynebacterium pseudotuberculosis]QBC00080.1 hypothetical protein Cp87MAT_1707 [Corynebacterium pseudotuberculosis]QBF72062.1 Hypothetical protein Cp99MAT_1708 [Corynebacterium pseudotuberculosis]